MKLSALIFSRSFNLKIEDTKIGFLYTTFPNDSVSHFFVALQVSFLNYVSLVPYLSLFFFAFYCTEELYVFLSTMDFTYIPNLLFTDSRTLH